MKKFFFTAIVTIAYSSTSFGSITEVEKQKEKEAEITVTEASCSRVWGATRIYCLNQGMSVEAADCIAWDAWRACVGRNIDAGIDYGPQC